MTTVVTKKSPPAPPNWRIRRAGKIIIISIFAALVVVTGAVLIWQRATLPEVEKENNIAFVLPEEIVLAGESIPLTWTDDNTGENLIIQSDRQYYDGRDSSEVYFSITNISGKAQKPDIQFLFDKKEGRGMKELALLNSQNENVGHSVFNKVNDVIASGQTNFYKAIIYYPQNSQGEFFIEAKGDNGGYGYLDPYYAGGLVGNWSFNGQDMDWASTTAEALDRSGYNNNGDAASVGDGSVGYWKLDENPAIDATPITDSSGQGNNGALTTNDGSTNKSVAGHLGQAINFDGTDDYVDLGNQNTSLRFTGNGTFSAWVKLDNSWTTEGYIFLKQSNGDYGISFSVDGDETVALNVVHTDGGAHQHDTYTLTTISKNAWHYLTGVWDSPNVYIYIDGVLDTTNNIGAGTLRTGTTYSSIIGARSDGTPDLYFNGLIDEVRIYNRALTASPVRSQSPMATAVPSMERTSNGASEVTDLYRIGAARMKVRQ